MLKRYEGGSVNSWTGLAKAGEERSTHSAGFAPKRPPAAGAAGTAVDLKASKTDSQDSIQLTEEKERGSLCWLRSEQTTCRRCIRRLGPKQSPCSRRR